MRLCQDRNTRKKLDVRKSNVTAVTKHWRRVSTEMATGMTVTATIMTAIIMTVTAHISCFVLEDTN
eukprot:13761148-Ditylum_brightwellii.AAC.1